MDELLAPFLKRNPVWPSTFPKILSVLAVATSFIILLKIEHPVGRSSSSDMDLSELKNYKIKEAIILLGLMVAYALLLRPAGFLLSTISFLSLGGVVLGERKVYILIPITTLATVIIWYLVQGVLGIFLRPLPFFI
tara:strand:+ start:317 stop:724 length:408 start_codon:yes stop_codon:yes gene_type:complete